MQVVSFSIHGVYTFNSLTHFFLFYQNSFLLFYKFHESNLSELQILINSICLQVMCRGGSRKSFREGGWRMKFGYLGKSQKWCTSVSNFFCLASQRSRSIRMTYRRLAEAQTPLYFLTPQRMNFLKVVFTKILALACNALTRSFRRIEKSSILRLLRHFCKTSFSQHSGMIPGVVFKGTVFDFELLKRILDVLTLFMWGGASDAPPCSFIVFNPLNIHQMMWGALTFPFQ